MPRKPKTQPSKGSDEATRSAVRAAVKRAVERVKARQEMDGKAAAHNKMPEGRSTSIVSPSAASTEIEALLLAVMEASDVKSPSLQEKQRRLLAILQRRRRGVA